MTIFTVSDVRHWQEIASSKFAPLECRDQGGDFSASIETITVSPFLSVARVQTSSLVVERTHQLVSQPWNDDVLFAIQLGSTGAVTQYGRTAELDPGYAVLYETNQPYVIENYQPHQHHLIARIKRSSLEISAATLQAVAARPISPSEPLLRIYTSYISELSENSTVLGRYQREELARITTELISSILRHQRHMLSANPQHAEELLLKMKAFISDNLGSPDLDVSHIAAAHHVSRRTVYETFGSLGTKPAAFIRKSRLKKAAAILADPANEALKVSSVAARCGFSDHTTFTRAFRREFGVTPLEWRA